VNGILHKCLPSVRESVSVFLLIVARQRFSKHVPAATNTRNKRRIVGCVVFYAVHVVSKESLRVCLCIPLSLLGNGSINTFPRQRGIVGGIVFYAVRVVSKESRRLVLPRTSCCLYLNCQLTTILMSGQICNPTFHSYQCVLWKSNFPTGVWTTVKYRNKF
jgi:hypothetical protein